MRFGMFDHLDRSGASLAQQYADRLEFAETADRFGFHGYHIAEHHSTTLGMAPSPSVFLSALTQRTTRMRLGSLVYILPLYNPLRLVEEICMLDHLSEGRLDIGVGRGASPFELAYYGVNITESRAIFDAALDVLMKGLTGERLSHRDEWFKYSGVPMMLRPLQQPHPPLWFAAGGLESLEFAAQRGMNVVAAGASYYVGRTIKRFHEAWDRGSSQRSRLGIPERTPMVGVRRHVVVAETDASAEGVARPAYKAWGESYALGWRVFNAAPTLLVEDYDEARRSELLVVGSPDTVRRELAKQIAETKLNYLIMSMTFGSMQHREAMRSLDLFAFEVMPHFKTAGEDAEQNANVAAG